MPRGRRAVALAAGVALATLALTGCRGTAGASPATAEDGRIHVVAAFYPLQYAAEQVGGDRVSVTNLTPPGAEPHDLELTAQQVADIASADVVLYVPGFQPAVDEAVQQQAPETAVDVTQGITLRQGDGGATDPHVWLDPGNLAAIGADVASRLTAVDPDHARSYADRLTGLQTAMTDLSGDFEKGLARCRTRALVTSHEAFAYLADRFGLDQVAIAGLSPDAEPSPARLREIADLVKARDVTTIYYETLVDPKVAETLATETGTAAAVLDPLEGLPAGSTADYPSVMRTNLATLEKGQGCT